MTFYVTQNILTQFNNVIKQQWWTIGLISLNDDIFVLRTGTVVWTHGLVEIIFISFISNFTLSGTHLLSERTSQSQRFMGMGSIWRLTEDYNIRSNDILK